MTSSKARRFHELHRDGDPMVLVNVWDPGSAAAIAAAGAPAIATSSAAVATAFGFADGERLPLELCLDNAGRIAAAVDLPVSVDFESGYGDKAGEVAVSLAALGRTGAVGCNIEDSDPRSRTMRSVAAQVERLKAAREGVALHPEFFINARCDLFFQEGGADHHRLIAEAIERADAYASAGADGFFVPGLAEPALVRALASQIRLPLNVMVLDDEADLGPLVAAGVARISFGPAPYFRAMGALRWLQDRFNAERDG